jgi:hypothetical protein
VGATPKHNEYTVVDGVGIVHIVNFPGRSLTTYQTWCGRYFGSDEIQAGTRVPTCLECISWESR